MRDPAVFIQQLRRLGQRDLGGVAILRRSLGAEPGADVRAYPFVEPYLPAEYPWTRTVYYLVAGLWASVNTASVLAAAADEDEEPAVSPAGAPAGPELPVDPARRDRRSFGHAAATLYLQRGKVESIERRFIALLDADEEQLPYHLRQMVQLVKTEEGIRIHWVRLLDDLLNWNHPERRVQQHWARAFYRTVNAAGATTEGTDAQGTEKGA